VQTQFKKSMGLNPYNLLWIRQCILIPKWLWCKTNLVLNLTLSTERTATMSQLIITTDV